MGIGSESVNVILFGLAVLRIALELTGCDPAVLPLTRRFERLYPSFDGRRFHRMGLYLGIGYVLLSLPALFIPS